MSWECQQMRGWAKRYIKEIWNPTKARAWIGRELDRRSNVRRKRRRVELYWRFVRCQINTGTRM
jgi:hypothetical protein